MDKLERLNFINQYLILERLYPEDADYYARNRKALEQGYELHYSWLTEHIYDDLPEQTCKEILDILDMYRSITFSLLSLSPNADIDDKYKFLGFDGNNETEYMGYVQYFINDLDRFRELTYGEKYCDFNSHCPMMPKYKKMLAIWRSGKKHNLSMSEINQITEA